MTRSIYEMTAIEAINDLQIARYPNADPVIEYIHAGRSMGYYDEQRAESLVEQAQRAERQQRARLKQAQVIMGRMAG